MAHVKLSADDIILAHRHMRDKTYYKVYTLVCRADINKPNSWNLTPSTDITVIGNSWDECDICLQAIQEVQKYQEQKYPRVKIIRETLADDINKFHNTIMSMYPDQKTK